MKKIFISLPFLIVFLSLALPHHAGAVATVVYPDPRTNQPSPVGVQPNIAGNVESTDTPVAPDITPEPATPAPAPVTPTDTSSSDSHDLWWALGFIGFIAIVLGLASQLGKKK